MLRAPAQLGRRAAIDFAERGIEAADAGEASARGGDEAVSVRIARERRAEGTATSGGLEDADRRLGDLGPEPWLSTRALSGGQR